MSSTTPVNSLARPSLSLEPDSPGQDLVVISRDLEGYRFLAQTVTAPVEVLLLSPAQDGIAAILQMLMALPSIRCLHLVTPVHGEGLQLGNVALRYDTLPNYAKTLCQWRSRLAPRAEIWIYNGEMARTEAGKLLIDVLHHLTGAAIAACTAFPNAGFAAGRWEFDCTTATLTPSLVLPLELVKQCVAANRNRGKESSFVKITDCSSDSDLTVI
ncbi:DUF4347 domain-containing protein [Nodosilinea sp. LEGE 07088]|uniref:DUF4347 domain-containing protein n=1 Tax=Nodosilinea sp. LEGE 07088 TaxID=2777968 RepID=UPI001882254A|nr:DUF4347 domain-containing protein [Nodosilinea sp. LEGE 07088]MBE9141018.1 DUF4347 domain-containing protein [Nodosilinea sp. LEGE 07088]